MDGANGFRGWRMVGIGFATQALAIGVTFGSFPVFLVPIAEAFDAGLMEVSLGMSGLMLTSTLGGAVVGPLLDRYSIRHLMAAGAALQGGCLLLMAGATALWQLGLLFGVGMALGVAMFGPLASATLVAKWFERSLGRAQGVTNMGGPAGVGLFSIVGGSLAAELGWRDTLFVYGLVVCAAVPWIAWTVRDRPEEIGQWRDGLPPPRGADPADPGAGDEATPVAATDAGWSMPRLLGARRFWLLVLPVGMLMGIAAGWGSQVVALGVDIGFDNASASSVFGASALLGILGTALFGALADRTSGRLLLWCLIGAHAAGFAALLSAPVRALFLAVVPLLGLLGGGMMPVYAALIGRLFGPASFGRVMGLGGILMAPFAVAAPALGAGLRDRTGSYAPTLLAFAAGMLLAGSLLAGLKVGRSEVR